MYRDHFAYFLTATNIEQKDATQMMKLMCKSDFFDGALVGEYDRDDAKNKRIFFDCGSKGCIEKIDSGEVAETMHTLAQNFPNARFHLLAENVDNEAEQYQMCTFGDMYQYSERQSYMPELSKPVPFDQYVEYQVSPHNNVDLNQFLRNTDFDLLYQQKLALVNAQINNEPVPKEVVDGLINFLDFIGDWAEREGVFRYPDLEEIEEKPQKPPLSQQIASAESRAGTPSSYPERRGDHEIS